MQFLHETIGCKAMYRGEHAQSHVKVAGLFYVKPETVFHEHVSGSWKRNDQVSNSSVTVYRADLYREDRAARESDNGRCGLDRG